MTIAKVTSLFGGLIYLSIFGLILLSSQVFYQIFSENFGIENKSLIALFLSAAFFVSFINFGFSYLIQQRENFHENMENAFFFSLQLLIIPAILLVGVIVAFANFK